MSNMSTFLHVGIIISPSGQHNLLRGEILNYYKTRKWQNTAEAAYSFFSSTIATVIPAWILKESVLLLIHWHHLAYLAIAKLTANKMLQKKLIQDTLLLSDFCIKPTECFESSRRLPILFYRENESARVKILKKINHGIFQGTNNEHMLKSSVRLTILF